MPDASSGDKQRKKDSLLPHYHRAVVLILVGYDFPIPIGLEMMKKGKKEEG